MKSQLFATASLAAIVLGFAASSALAAPVVTVTPTWDHPSAKVGVSGTGFAPGETIDIYFDTTDELLAVADSGGKFAKHTFKSPGDALPGQHWVTAIGRKTGDAAQKPFTVSTAWAEFGFKPNGKRDNPWENVISASNVKELDTAWVNAASGFYLSSPVLANGVVYIGSDYDGSLYAFDAGTGTKLWSAATSDFIESSPAVANGIVYIGSADQSLYAFNANSGAKLWAATTGGWILSSPAVANGIVYVGSADGNLYAFDASAGTKLWSASIGGSASFAFSSPAVANGMVYIGSEDGSIYAFDARTGAKLWSVATGYSITSSPVVVNGVVYVAPNVGNFYAFNARTGAVLWTAATDVGVGVSSPSVSNGVVYVGSGYGYVYAFDARSGVKLWSAAAGGGAIGGSSVAVADDIVYVASEDGSLCAFDAESGMKLWRALVDGYDSSPAISDGMVYIGAYSGLHAYALNGGNNAIYKHRQTQPPSFASLHPDYRLKP